MWWQVVLHTYAVDESQMLDDAYEIAKDDLTETEARDCARELNRKYPRCGAFARPKE